MQYVLLAAGLVLVLVTLMDVYLTVLYARSGAGLITPTLNAAVWTMFRHAGRALPGIKGTVLTFAGPTLVSLTILTWVLLLLVGFAWIVWPALGTGVQASHGATSTDFVTAVYYSGYSMTTLGNGDLTPKTAFYRLLMVAQGFTGFAVLTLALTYISWVYSAITRRNAFALLLHYMAGGHGDAAELVARLGADGSFDGARQAILRIAGELVALLESHHAYPVLHYFQFRDPAYSMARIVFVALDAATLIRTALDSQRYRGLSGSAATEALWGGGLRLVNETVANFLPRSCRALPPEPSDAVQHYERALERLRAAGLTVTADPTRYTAARSEWEPQVRALANYMAETWTDVAPYDPDGGKLDSAPRW